MKNSFKDRLTRPYLINKARPLARGFVIASALLIAESSLPARANPDSKIFGSTHASFSPGMRVLTVRGDKSDNVISVGMDEAGTILINGGAVPIKGGMPTAANTHVIRVYGSDGDDQLWAEEFNGPLPPLELSGGEGDDLLVGGSSNDYLDGGPGNDTLAGQAGENTLLGGDDSDLFVFDHNKSSDLLEGGAGVDALIFNGLNVNEIGNISSQDGRLAVVRNIGPLFIDADDLEEVLFNAFGGADNIRIHDLTGSDVQTVTIDLSGEEAPGLGDQQPDRVIVEGSFEDEAISVVSSSDSVSVLGFGATIEILGSEAAHDQLVINALGGADVVNASGLQAGHLNLRVDGGEDDDTLTGSAGDDVLIGGWGDDFLSGGPGLDTLDGGSGNNTIIQD